ncbi:MAG: hypothetical protein AB1817_21325, partial [Chloroflexota bacterium]
GQCSTLRWDADGVREVYFEGVGVTGHEQQQECPTQTTTYTLGVVFQDGTARNYTATVNVAAAVVTTGKPDLVIVDARIEPSEVTAGQPFNVVYTIENRGDVASGPFTIFWQFHEATGLKNCCSKEISSGIAAKGWGGGTFANLVTNSPAGTSPSWVEVDYNKRVDEGAAGEANNKVSLTLTVKSGGASSSFAATNATISVNRSSYNGPCPNTFTAGSKITANGAGTVKYRWERSDGTNSETRTLQFDAAGEKAATNYDWSVGASGNYWMRLHVLEPNDLVSNRGETTWNCAAGSGFQVTSVKADVDPEIFSGTCPKSVTYTGKITTNGAGTVSYRWVRSDGTGETRTLNFSAAGTQSVANVNVNYAHSATHWAKLEVLAPNAMISEQAKFTLNCTSPAIVTLVSVNTNPTAFTGTCPHTFHFNGTIVTNAPGTVTYRWER